MKNTLLLIIGLQLLSIISFAQVAINENGTEANGSAMLDIQSINKGLLIPRMTQLQRNSILNPAQGLMVFVIEENSFYFFDNSNWEELGKGASGWELQNSIISTDSLHQVIIGSNSGSGIFEVVTDKATGTYTANQCLSGIATAQENAAGKLPSNAFDTDNNTYWSNDGTLSVWLQYNFGEGEGKVIAKYRMYYQGASYESSPKDWNFQASNDGTTWTSLNSQTNQNWDSNSWKDFTFTNTTRYEYYRILITDNQSNSDDFVYISEMEMQEMTYSNHNTLFVNNNMVGIGTASPQATLHIDGTVRFTDGNQASGKILTSDASGNATWENNVTATDINGLSDGKTDAASLFLGNGAGSVDDGSNNQNTGIGINALQSNTYGSQNTAIGYRALNSNTTANDNTATGLFAMEQNITGYGNSAYGSFALGFNTIGFKNMAFGNYSLYNNTTGNYNTSLGYGSNNYNQTGSYNTTIGYEAGRGTALHNKTGNIFLGYKAGYHETGSNKLYIENSSSSTPLIGGDFDADEVYFNTDKLGIGTSIPREALEVASRTGSYGRMIVSDGGGDSRNVILFVSPTASNQTARIEAFNYGTGGGLPLNINTTGNSEVIFGGNVLPENHISKNLGALGQAWNNVYAHNFVTQGSAAFADINVTEQLINFPPTEKQAGAFDEFTEKGLKELDPASLPENLREDNAILIDEMTTYNYKANYEQQLQIEELLSKNKEQQKIIDKLIIRLNKLENN